MIEYNIFFYYEYADENDYRLVKFNLIYVQNDWFNSIRSDRWNLIIFIVVKILVVSYKLFRKRTIKRMSDLILLEANISILYSKWYKLVL